MLRFVRSEFCVLFEFSSLSHIYQLIFLPPSLRSFLPPSLKTSMHFYAWKKGLKTGMYYLRTKPAASAIQFTVDKQPVLKKRRKGASEEVGGEGRGPMTAVSIEEEEEEELNDEDDDEDGENGDVGACGDDVCLSCQG